MDTLTRNLILIISAGGLSACAHHNCDREHRHAPNAAHPYGSTHKPGYTPTGPASRAATIPPWNLPRGQVPWSRAADMINNGSFISATQTRDGFVIFRSEHMSGHIKSIPPHANALYDAKRQCGARCANMAIMTE